MATTATETPAPEVTIEDAGPCRKKLAITVSPEAVAQEIESTLDTLLTGSQLPGFRRGKAPRSLIEKRFGKAGREEAKQRLASSAYQEVLKEHDLRVVGEPEGGDELKDAELDPTRPLVFTIEVEVAPEVTLPDLSGVSVVRPVIEIQDDMVDAEMERFCADQGSLENRDSAQRGDYCTGDGVMTKEGGEEALNVPGAVIQIPAEGDEGMVLGVKVDDFYKQVGKPKPGDTLSVATTGPENHEDESIRGASVVVTFKVNDVYRVTPASPDEAAQKLGLESGDQLRELVTNRLEQRASLEQHSVMRQQLADKLIDEVDMELPEKTTSAQAARNLERRRLDLMHRGVEAQEIETHMADLRAASDDVAQRELKLFFLLDAAAREMDVEITEQEINGRIAQMAASRGMRPGELRQQLTRSNNLYGIAQQIREHKTLDALLVKATIEDMPLEEFNAMQRGEDPAAASGAAKKSAPKKKTPKKEAEAASTPAPAEKKTKKKTSKKTTKKTSKKKK